MGDIAAYILLFSIGFGALYAYQHRRLRTKYVRLSVQHYPECILKVMLEKKQGTQKTIILRIMGKTNLQLSNAQLELIDKDRSFHVILLNEKEPAFSLPPAIDAGRYFDLKMPFDGTVEMIRAEAFKFKTFRFVVENNKGKKYKSHELTINRKGHLYLPYTGRYN